ncbi:MULTISPECIES: hypothetical protein [unclassified Treponema]|uniref:hypothetical protein n=1 Tax=unclassified Treponema TaxID=2638727 RepID=UPI0020A2D050|nr:MULTISPECIES: hypothetical protein [unclassified Treponema]UTC68423.1 hypothetical protein E4O06_07275 [Treponema sp. OMZ 789]UTC68566.1 hypothetical protein E4O01_07415 [Treponema sp. OMZ 790]UTC71296.1 hypothetical protein E4O02_07605 [Treponema sp. OMZ 791]
MKLKVLFIIFNIVLGLLLFTMFFLPLFYADGSFMRDFWKANWFFGPVFFVLIVFVNILFVRNKTLISYIEAEDWASLASLLEIKIYSKQRVTYKNSRLLTEALLLLGDFSSMNKLCSFLKENKPRYLLKLGPKFAAAKMISGNYQDVFDFTSSLPADNKSAGEWCMFYSALSLQMLKKYEESAVLFAKVSDTVKNPLIKTLSTYFVVNVLQSYSKLTEEEIKEKSLLFRSKINKDYSHDSWKAYTESEKQEIHVMILTKIIDDVSSWLFF